MQSIGMHQQLQGMTLESSLHSTYNLNMTPFLCILLVLVVHFGGVATYMVESNGEEWGTGQSFRQYTCFNTLANHSTL